MEALSSFYNRVPDPPSLDCTSALLELISELSVHEIDSLQMKQRVGGRTRSAGTATDDKELALAVFADEAASLLNISRDHILNPRRREDLLDQLIAIEETARYDHALALALSEGRRPPPRPPGLKRRARHRAEDLTGASSAGFGTCARSTPVCTGKGKIAHRTDDSYEQEGSYTPSSFGSDDGKDGPISSHSFDSSSGPHPAPNTSPFPDLIDGLSDEDEEEVLTTSGREATRHNLKGKGRSQFPTPLTHNTMAAPAASSAQSSHWSSLRISPSSRSFVFVPELKTAPATFVRLQQPPPLPPRRPSIVGRGAASNTAPSRSEAFPLTPVDAFAKPRPRTRATPALLAAKATRPVSGPVSAAPMTAPTPRSLATAEILHAGAPPNVSSVPAIRPPPATPWNVAQGWESAAHPGPQTREDARKPILRAIAERSSGPTENLGLRRKAREQVRSRMMPQYVRDLFHGKGPGRSSSPPAALPGPSPFLETSYKQLGGERVGRTVVGQRPAVRESLFGASDASASRPSFSHQANGGWEALQDIDEEVHKILLTTQVSPCVSSSQLARETLSSEEEALYSEEETLYLEEEALFLDAEGLYSEEEESDGSQGPVSLGASGEEISDHSAHDYPVNVGRPNPTPDQAVRVSFFSPVPSEAQILPNYSQPATQYDYAPQTRTPSPSEPRPSDHGNAEVQLASARAILLAGPTMPQVVPASPNRAARVSAAPAPPAMPTPLTARPAAPEASPAAPPSSSSACPSAVCAVCLYDATNAVVLLACGHAYHPACVRTMFENAASNESLFPPKCCGATIGTDMVRPHLDSSLLYLYRRREREFGTANRVYCHNPRCSAFLGAATPHAGALYCVDCTRETCARCKQEAHPLRSCSAAAEEAVLKLGRQQQWQRCPSCRTLVERTEGCPHMTCWCGTQFCYLCGRLWASCNNNCAR